MLRKRESGLTWCVAAISHGFSAAFDLQPWVCLHLQVLRTASMLWFVYVDIAQLRNGREIGMER
jgi:hypothetical protein